MLTKLIDIFTNLYSNERSARRVVDEAGLDNTAIDFSGPARNIWHAILTEAEKNRQVDSLFDVAWREYGANEILGNTYVDYLSFVNQDDKIKRDDEMCQNSDATTLPKISPLEIASDGNGEVSPKAEPLLTSAKSVFTRFWPLILIVPVVILILRLTAIPGQWIYGVSTSPRETAQAPITAKELIETTPNTSAPIVITKFDSASITEDPPSLSNIPSIDITATATDMAKPSHLASPWITVTLEKGEAWGEVGPPSYCISDYKVALYVYNGSDMWILQAVTNKQSNIKINQDCTWRYPIKSRNKVAAHLVEADYEPQTQVPGPWPCTPLPSRSQAKDSPALAADCFPKNE